MLSPRRGLAILLPSSPPPVPLGWRGPSSHGRRETEKSRDTGCKERGRQGTRSRRSRDAGRGSQGARTGERYIFPAEFCGREIESRESDKPRRGAQHPPHYAHRSRDFNVPLEMAACRAEFPEGDTPRRSLSTMLRAHRETGIINDPGCWDTRGKSDARSRVSASCSSITSSAGLMRNGYT